MENKKITYLFMLLGGLVLVGLLFYLLSSQTSKIIPPSPEVEEEVTSDEVKGAVIVSALLSTDETDNDTIEIALQAKDANPVLLSAVGVRGFISGADFTNETALTITKNVVLSDNGWQYQISSAEVQSDGRILVELSANHRGDELYTLSSTTILATIPLTQDYPAGSLNFELDTESTVFAGDDVEVLYPYQSK